MPERLSQAGQVTVDDTVDDDLDRSLPGGRVQRLRCSVEHGRPGALQEHGELLAAAAGTRDQLFATGAQMPQPGVDGVGAFRDVAAQLRGQVGDQDRVTLVGPVAGVVLAFTLAMDQQWLHAHQIEAEPVTLLGHCPPAMTGRLTRHDHIVEPGALRLVTGPHQRPRQLPRAGAVQPASGQHRTVVIDHDQLLDPIGEIDPTDRPVTRHHLAQPSTTVVAAGIAP